LDGDKSTLARDDVGIGFVIAYSIIACAFYVCMVHSIFVITLPPKRREYFGNILFLLPWTSLVLLLESCSLAVEASGVERKSHVHRMIIQGWVKTIYVLHATIAPSILIGTFEITFLVHKTRLLSFCCLPRYHPPEDDNLDENLHSSNVSLENNDQQNHRTDQLQLSQQSQQFGWRGEEQKVPSILQKYNSWILRSGILFSAVLLFVLSIIVYFPSSNWPRFLQDDAQNWIGRTGWSALVVSRYNFRLLLSLLPIAIVSVSCIYFAMTLWRYGTTYAMVVHSSWFHPWFLPFYGDIVMLGTQWVGGHTWFPLFSRIGILVYLECLNWALQEVSMDIEAAKQFQSFLQVVGTTERVLGHASTSGGGFSSNSINQEQHRRQQIAAANSTSNSLAPTSAAVPPDATETTTIEPRTQRRRQPPQLEQELVEISSTVP
jgi:hypothetical protein